MFISFWCNNHYRLSYIVKWQINNNEDSDDMEKPFKKHETIFTIELIVIYVLVNPYNFTF